MLDEVYLTMEVSVFFFFFAAGVPKASRTASATGM